LFPIVQDIREGKPTGLVADVEGIAARIAGSMTFVPDRESDIIRIYARGSNPREAAVLANTYAEAYVEQTVLQSRSSRDLSESFSRVDFPSSAIP